MKKRSNKKKKTQKSRFLTFIRNLYMSIMCIGIVGMLTVLICNLTVVSTTRDRIYTSPEEIEGEYDAIIVLGCKVHSDGSPSTMLLKRIEGGVKLYESKASEYILMSGDSKYENYSETECMKNIAVTGGVPEDAILLDGLGLSTAESMIRAKEEYGLSRVIIVTQDFHCARSVYYADMAGLDAVAMSAEDYPYPNNVRLRNNFREVLARGGAAFYRLYYSIFGA